ncbi:MAG: hydrolase [Caulobacteraceae bacterium]|nr:hydrolase [Caulobacteraceae bacterium]
MCDEDIWRDQIAALGADFDVFCPGFLDHSSIEDMAQDVLDRAPPTFSLCGHSMGARVALEIVRRAPERVERLALLDTGFHPAKPGEANSRDSLLRIAFSEGMASLAARWLPPMLAHHRVADTRLMERLTAMVARANPCIYRRQINALLHRPNAHKALGAITCPTAVIVGKLDTWSPPAQHEELAASIPNAYLTVIDDSGHMSPVEQPEAVTEALKTWMTTSAASEDAAAV